LDLNNSRNLFVVASILISGIGGLTIKIPYMFAPDGTITNTIQITSIATALIIGIMTNAILGKVEKSKLGSSKTEE
ncbi:MAG: hypothetical protein IKV40_06965, partial [Clostridia bacterium]|nr:hypothetical protein [Clostridia bacterium]